MFELLLTICFVSTTTILMKCLVNWIPLNTHVCFEQKPFKELPFFCHFKSFCIAQAGWRAMKFPMCGCFISPKYFWFCFAATQLALQVHQERSQVSMIIRVLQNESNCKYHWYNILLTFIYQFSARAKLHLTAIFVPSNLSNLWIHRMSRPCQY